MLISAAHFAAQAHAPQRRKDPQQTPYINHPISVAHALSEAGVTDEAVLSAALLHDVLEDCGVKVEELEKRFGAKVARIVQECSDDKSLSKVERKKLQIEHARTVSDDSKLVKLADKLDNCKGLLAGAPANWSVERIQGYLVWAKKVVDQLCANGNSSPAHKLLEDQLRNDVFAKQFSKDHGGQKHACIPPDENTVLEQFYAQLENVND